MEHLPMPKGAVLNEEDNVPYVASTDYLGVPFLLYPQEKGFHHAVPPPNYPSLARYESVHPTPDDKFEPFLQTWLFFGLLQEVFGSLYQHEDFVRDCESNAGPFQVLTTTKLAPLLSARFPVTPDMGDAPSSLIDHLVECTKVAWSAVDLVSSRLSRKVAFSILATLETLCSALNSCLIQDFKFPLSWMASFDKTHWIDQMSLNGWCAREAAIASTSFVSGQAVHYMSKVIKTYKDDRHRGCGKEECIGMQIDLAKYEPRHCDLRCDCAVIPIDHKRLNSILEGGKLPLLSIEVHKSTGELKVELVESTGDTCYVALSHVWADGLGNPFSNALAKCQLLSLQSLAQSVIKASETDDVSGTSPALLWLDTLCVPCEPGDGKTFAMGQMRSTYQNAQHVLVLDSSLRFCNLESIGLLEAAVRIFTSPWLRRLWCLQEGAHAKRLWFQFQDRPVELAEIFKELRAEYQSRNSLRKEVMFDVMSVYRHLRLFVTESAKSEAPPVTLNIVARALRYRGVSVLSDEAICLANLFEVDAKVHTGPHEGRMSQFWVALCESRRVPSSIIFSKCSNLREAGFRWAPRTLLGLERPLLSALTDNLKPATFSPKGLLVSFPGLLISKTVPDTISSTFNTRSELPGVWHFFDQRKDCWYGISTTTADVQAGVFKEWLVSPQASTLKQENAYAIIFSHDVNSQKSTSNSSSGLLVTIKAQENGVYDVRLQNQVGFVTLNPGECLVFNLARKIAQSLSRDELTKVIYQLQDMEVAERADTLNREFQAFWAKMTQAAEEALEIPAFKSIHDANFPVGSAYLVAMIWKLYKNRFTVIKEWLPKDTLWCVD